MYMNWGLAAVSLLFLGIVYAFTPEEVEIFQVQNELTRKYGSEMDFYRFLKLPKLRDSTSKEIIKNLRQLSKKYHPDRNRKYKKLYEKLNIITNILSDDSRRKTYDYYLKNGFPDYNYSKGGFFFKRVQPKTWFLILFVFTIASFFHYILLKLQNNSNKKRIESFIKQCKDNDDTRGLGEKRLTFTQYEGAEPKEIQISLGDVYVVESNGKKSLISTENIKDPGVFDTLPFKLPFFIWRVTIGRFSSESKSAKEQDELRSDEDIDDGENVEGGDFEKTETKGSKKIKRKTKAPANFREKAVLPNGDVVYARKKR